MKVSVNKREYGSGMFILPNNTIFEGEKGTISLLPPSMFTSGYEIYCQEGDLFHDVEKYDTLELALERIAELLDEPLPENIEIEQ